MAQTQCLSRNHIGHPAKSQILWEKGGTVKRVTDFLQKKSEQAKLVPTLAGAEGFEPSARGFGDHCSTN